MTAPAVVTAATARLLDRWVVCQRAEGVLPRTYGERRRVVERVAAVVDRDPLAFTADDVAGYLAGLPGAGTRATYWGAVRAWFRWVVDEGLLVENPMNRLRRPRVPRRLPRPVTDEQLMQVLATVNRRRTRTWILLAAYQGLRVSEIAQVRGDDVDLYANTLRVVGKGGVPASLPLHPRVVDEAHDYPTRGWWFPAYEAQGRAGDHVRSNTVSQTVSATFARAGLACTAHQLRHWFGTTTLASAGGNLRVAQEALRHASVATTALYTKVDDADVRAAVQGLPDLSVSGMGGPGWSSDGYR